MYENHKRNWTKKQEETLITLNDQSKTWEDMQKATGRSKYAVKKRLSLLGIPYKHTPSVHSKQDSNRIHKALADILNKKEDHPLVFTCIVHSIQMFLMLVSVFIVLLSLLVVQL